MNTFVSHFNNETIFIVIFILKSKKHEISKNSILFRNNHYFLFRKYDNPECNVNYFTKENMILFLCLFFIVLILNSFNFIDSKKTIDQTK